MSEARRAFWTKRHRGKTQDVLLINCGAFATVNRGDSVRPWMTAAPAVNANHQFAAVTIHIHSLIALQIQLETVDHGALPLGYELSNSSTVLT